MGSQVTRVYEEMTENEEKGTVNSYRYIFRTPLPLEYQLVVN